MGQYISVHRSFSLCHWHGCAKAQLPLAKLGFSSRSMTVAGITAAGSCEISPAGRTSPAARRHCSTRRDRRPPRQMLLSACNRASIASSRSRGHAPFCSSPGSHEPTQRRCGGRPVGTMGPSTEKTKRARRLEPRASISQAVEPNAIHTHGQLPFAYRTIRSRCSCAGTSRPGPAASARAAAR
jgi:hypothetical protein